MANSSKTPTPTGEGSPSIPAKAAEAPPFPTSSSGSSTYQTSAPQFSFGPRSKMLELSKAASAVEPARSSLAEVGRSTPIPTSSNSSTHQTSAPQFSFGRLSQKRVESSQVPSSTTGRAKSILADVGRESPIPHQSSPQQFRFGPNKAPQLHQTRDRRDPDEGKAEAQAERIKALESGFGLVTERLEKASHLVEKYEALLKTVEKEYADKMKFSEDNNKLALEKVANDHMSQIKALEDEKKTWHELKEVSEKVANNHITQTKALEDEKKTWQELKEVSEKAANNHITQIKALEDEKKTWQGLKEVSEKGVKEWQKKCSILEKANEEHIKTISFISRTKADLEEELDSSLTTIKSLKEKNKRLTATDKEWEALVDTIEFDNEGRSKEFSAIQKQNEECLAVIRALNESRLNLENELEGSFAILETLETEVVDGEKKDESANLIEPLIKDDEVIADNGLEKDEQVKQSDVMLSALVESSEKKKKKKEEEEESNERKKVKLLHQSLQILSLILIICFVLLVLWIVFEARWSWHLGINVEHAVLLFRIWILNLGNRFLFV